MKVLTTFFLALAPFTASADYICTYKSWYFLEDDGSMKQTTKGIQIGKRFTVTNNGKTGGEIEGDFEVYDDGQREGYAFKGMQTEDSGQQLLRMLDPQKYADEDQAALIKKERSIPRILYIEQFADSELKPFILYWGGNFETGTCEKL